MIAQGASLSRQAAAHGIDPIYAAIEAHKAAVAHVKTVLDTHTILETELPRERRSNVDAWEEVIVETDDPRWIECERAVMRAWDAEEDAARDLVCIQPTTRAGFLALLDHAIVYDTDGYAWPSSLQSDEGERTPNWHQFRLENLVASKAALVAA
jgi:hypothetical protein